MITVSTPRTPSCQHSTTEVPIDQVYLIWSYKHNAWWGAGYCGYTTELMGAGMYTKEAAEGEGVHSEDGERPSSEARHFLTELPLNRPRAGNTVFSVFDSFIANAVLA